MWKDNEIKVSLSDKVEGKAKTYKSKRIVRAINKTSINVF